MTRVFESRTLSDEAKHELRRKFYSWGIAIVASLTTTATVSLPSPVWAQEEAQTKKADDKDAESKGDESEAAAEEEAPKKLDLKTFSELRRKGEFGKMVEAMDLALESDPADMTARSLNISVATSLYRNDPKACLARLREQYEYLLEEGTDKAAFVLMSTARTLTMYDTKGEAEGKLEVFDTAIAKLKSWEGGEDFLATLVEGKAQLMMRSDMGEEAKELMDGLLAETREAIDPKDKESLRSFISMASTYVGVLSSDYEEETDALFAEAKTIAVDLLDDEDAKAKDFSTLSTLMMRPISMSLYSDPKKADEMLSMLEEKSEQALERFEDDEKEVRLVKSASRSLTSMRSRLQSALEREQLIGTEAAEIDAEAFVATDPVSMADLKGKVVLIDFWAVWCGPCIATFPHLIEWHEEYSDEGLVILGATKFYKRYSWDKEAGKLGRPEEELSAEEELAMLEDFREHHGLLHGFFVSPEGSEYSKQFKVSGIPQAVLIDKEGKIAMIKVGSGESNATALHAKIEELLSR
ncbi:MAG: TlpA family protein disulfide reductase [Pirellulaceae bacterium]